jgi:hypothetical protein
VIQDRCNSMMKDATDRQTDMDGPIRCFSPTLKRKEHVQMWFVKIFRFYF